MDFLHENDLFMIQQEENWYNLRAKMIKLEHVAIINEDEILLEDGKKSFAENVINMLKNIKQAISKLFNEFVKWFKSIISGTKFEDNNYRKLAKKKGITNITFKGFVYKNLDSEIKKLSNTFLTIATTSSSKLRPKTFFKDCSNLLNLHFEGESSSSFLFKMEYQLYLLDKKDSRENITMSVEDLIKMKNNFENRLNEVTKIYEDANKNIDSIIKNLEQNDHIKNIKKLNNGRISGGLMVQSDDQRVMLHILSAAKYKAQAINIIFTEIIRAVKTQTNQAKRALGSLKEVKEN